MRRLLKDTEARRLALVEFLTDKHTWVTIAELSEYLNCSQRVIKDDLAFLRSTQQAFSIKSSYHGNRIEYGTNSSINRYYQYVLANSTIFQVLEAVFFNQKIKPYDLQEKLYMSQSTYYRLIRTSNPILKEIFNIELDVYTANVVGDEASIRYFYYVYFSEKYSSLEWGFDNINEHALRDLIKLGLRLIEQSLSYSNFSYIKLMVAVNLTRYHSDDLNTIDPGETLIELIWDKVPPMTPHLYEILKELNIHLSKEMILDIFGLFIHKDFIYGYKQLEQLIANDSTMARNLTFVSQLLDDLSLKYSVPINNKQEVLWFLHNIAYNEGFIPHTAYIFFNPNADLMTKIQTFNPDFLNELTVGIQTYREGIDIPMTHFTIEHLVYQVCVKWQGLIIDLYAEWSKVQAILVSDFSDGRNQLIQDLIQEHLGKKIILNVFEGSEITPEVLEQLDTELIITTTPLPHLTSSPVYCIDGNISSQNISELHNFIEEIASRKVHCHTDKSLELNVELRVAESKDAL